MSWMIWQVREEPSGGPRRLQCGTARSSSSWLLPREVSPSLSTAWCAQPLSHCRGDPHASPAPVIMLRQCLLLGLE